MREKRNGKKRKRKGILPFEVIFNHYISKENAKKYEDCPPGMMIMKEEDRLETLRVLEESMNFT